MKNTILKKVGGMALAILMLAVFAQVRVFAQEDTKTKDQDTEQTTEDASARRENAKKLIGTWDVQVTIRNCQTGAAIRTFASMATYMSGGTRIGSTSGIPQALRTPEHGVWSYLGGRNYRLSFKSFSFDAANNFTGWSIVRHQLTLNRRADEGESAGTLEVYAPNGTLVSTGCSTTTTTKFE